MEFNRAECNTMNTTIKVKYVNEPPAGKKLGTIKTDDGKIFGVWPDRLKDFAVGSSYEVEYSERNFNGKTFTKIEKVLKQLGGTNGSANGQSNGSTGGSESSGSRSARIERQHSQEMALRYFVMLVAAEQRNPTLEELRARIDWFQADLENAERVKAEASEAAALADGSDNGSEGAGFEV